MTKKKIIIPKNPKNQKQTLKNQALEVNLQRIFIE